MGLIERIQADRRVEQRVIGGVPWRPWDLGSPYWKFNIGGPIHPSRAFYGQDQALGLPALYSCTRLLAENLASLPLRVYLSPPGSNSTTRWSGPTFFDTPSANTDVTLFDWLYQCMTSLLLHGNAWGMITGRDGYGYPTGIDWIPPDLVDVQDDPRQPWNPQRTRVYVYGRLINDWRNDLFHVKGYTLPGRTEGLSPLRAFAMTVLSGIESAKYGVDWFTHGGFPSGVFKNEELEVSKEDAEAIRESLVEAIMGHKPLVIGRDWDYKPVSVPPSEAQFLEATQMNATQLAAIFGLPPDRVGGSRGDSLTYNTVEQSTLQVIEALRPWMVRLENAFFRLLPANRYCRFNADALLKTDLKTRTEIYAQQRSIGLRTTNELRDLEDLEPMPGAAGGEIIPLDVMIAMARSIRGIPNSMLKGITLEMDLAVDRLEKLQKEGIAAPDTEPAVKSPSSVLANTVTQTRDSLAGEPFFLDHDGTEELIRLLRKAAAAGRERLAHQQPEGPEHVGPWIPRGGEDASDFKGGDGNEPYDRAMYTAHRLDETTRNLAHATERIEGARRARGNARAYETEHVVTDLSEAADSAKRLAHNVRANYPAEGAELERIEQMMGTGMRAQSLSPRHKSVTFAHLLNSVAYDQGHALRHAQMMAGETDDNSMWNFDAQHCAKHTASALEHAHKLAAHIRDNYPDEARWLTGLGQLTAGAGTNHLNGHNGNGRAH